jgi:Fe-S-cluster-containing hydrogenase component 2
MEPMGKVLAISPEKCTGCRLCELVCSVFHDGVSNASRSRIKIMKWEAEGLYIPMSCQQCQDPQCVRFCEVKAVDYVDADRVSLSKKKAAAEKITAAQKQAVALESESH